MVRDGYDEEEFVGTHPTEVEFVGTHPTEVYDLGVDFACFAQLAREMRIVCGRIKLCVEE